MNNKIKTELINSLIIAIIFISIVEFSLFNFEQNAKLDEPYEWGEYYEIPQKFNDALHTFNDNPGKIRIIALGDSRIRHGLNPLLIDSYFNNETITYNLGIRSSEIYFQSLFVQKLIIPRLKPDFIIWEAAFDDFGNTDLNNEAFNGTLGSPQGRFYSNLHEELNSTDLRKDYLRKYSRIYRYRTLFIPDSLGLTTFPEKMSSSWRDPLRGFFACDNITDAIHFNELTIIKTGWIMDPERKEWFLNAMEMINRNQIPYLWTNPPAHFLYYEFPEFDPFMASFPVENTIDLRGNTSFMNVSLYIDGTHLNSDGAALYTNIVLSRISDSVKRLINQNKHTPQSQSFHNLIPFNWMGFNYILISINKPLEINSHYIELLKKIDR